MKSFKAFLTACLFLLLLCSLNDYNFDSIFKNFHRFRCKIIDVSFFAVFSNVNKVLPFKCPFFLTAQRPILVQRKRK